MSQSLNTKNAEDRELIINVITLFLENNSVNEIYEKTSVEKQLIEKILSKQIWVKKFFCEEDLEKYKSLKKQEKEQQKEKEYKELMDKILFYILNSLYTYVEISDILFISVTQLQEMLYNSDYIEMHYGKDVSENVKELRKIRRKMSSDVINGTKVPLRAPEYRSLVKPDVISVSSYEFELVDKVLLFLKNGGDTEKTAMNSKYRLNEIVASLNDIKLKDLLQEQVYNNVQNLLEIDAILTQNRTKERNELIKSVVIILFYEDGNTNTIKEALGCSKEVIERILNHPYVPILCNKLGIKISSDILSNEKEKEEIKVEKIYK